MLGIHEEMHRLVLRSRWLRWSLRNYTPGCYREGYGRHWVLSERLARWRPTWAQRQAELIS